VTKKFIDNNPAIGRLFDQETSRIAPLIERRRAVTARDRTEALLHIATAAAANYRREKQERGLLDYDDLIDRRSPCSTASPPAGCITSSIAASTTS